MYCFSTGKESCSDSLIKIALYKISQPNKTNTLKTSELGHAGYRLGSWLQSSVQSHRVCQRIESALHLHGMQTSNSVELNGQIIKASQ